MNGVSIRFGDIAVHEGYIHEETLKECLELQKLYREPTLLGEILVEKGYLTPKHIERILKVQKYSKTLLENEYFSHIALKKKYLTTKQLRELRRKFAFETAKGNSPTLASVAVSEEYLSMQIVEMILKEAEYQHFLKLKQKNMSALGGYELIGHIIKLKRASLYKAIQVELERVVAMKNTHERIRKCRRHS